VETVAPRKGFDVVAYLKLFRFPLVFTAIADSAAGYLSGSGGSPHYGVLALLAICSSGLYFFGMAMNDIADRNRDRELAPTRVLPSGRISLRGACIAAFCCLAISLGALVIIPKVGLLQRLIVWLLAVGAIVGYDFAVKVPPTMGLVRASNLLLGVMAGMTYWGEFVGEQMVALAFFAVPSFVYVTSLTFVSTLEEGEVKRGRLVVGACGMALAALMASQWIPLTSDAFSKPIQALANPLTVSAVVSNIETHFGGWFKLSPAALICSSTLIGWIAFRAWRARDRKGVMLLVRDGIGGIILLDAAWLMSEPRDNATLHGILLMLLVLPAIVSVALFKRLA